MIVGDVSPVGLAHREAKSTKWVVGGAANRFIVAGMLFRDRARLGLILALAGCNPTLFVVEAPVGEKTPRDVGFEYELAHLHSEDYALQKPGMYVLVAAPDWLEIWENGHTADAKLPVTPEVDWSATEALAIVASDEKVSAVQVDRIIETKGVLHVYVNEELLGDRCVPPVNKNPLRAKTHEWPMDVVTFRKRPIPLTVHVDKAKGLSCDPVPKVDLKCVIAGTPAGDSSTINAQPGQVIECDGTKATAAIGFISDRNWYFEKHPQESFAKFEVEADEQHAKFTIDAYGEYQVKMEAIDDRTKHGDGRVSVMVAPTDNQVIQLGWTQWDRKDDPNKYPKLEVHFVEVGFPLGTKDHDCTEGAPTSFCAIKLEGLTRQITVKNTKGRYKLAVKYVDGRGAQQPVLCAHTFAKGSTVAVESCNYTEQAPGASWEPGVLNQSTGGFEDPNKPKTTPKF